MGETNSFLLKAGGAQRRGGSWIMTLRKAIFWLHLIVGVSTGLVILIMSVTGVMPAYEKADSGVGRRQLHWGRAEISSRSLAAGRADCSGEGSQ
jgi:hypothetical protein